jgi:hypothetical protein
MAESAFVPVPAAQPGFEERLSLEKKITLLTGADFWTPHGHAGIVLRPIRMSDGPAGVRGPRWDERDTALNVSAPVALAATWDIVSGGCAVESGGYLLSVGRSSRDLPMAVTVAIGLGPERRSPGC